MQSDIQARLSKTEISKPLLDRFIRYVKVYTTSDSSTPESKKPSTERQWDLARMLEGELKALGIQDVSVDEHAYVIAHIPASPGCESAPSIAFMAHMDTAEEVTGENVQPQVHENYDGKPIKLLNGIEISPESTRQLLDCIGDTVITTDGSTLLGGDDKAGVAIIMTSLDQILHHSIQHGPLEIIFNSDEEVCRGTDYFPTDKIHSKMAYTVDGSEAPKLEYECFNAVSADINFTGVAVHPGYARGVLVNACTMAAQFISMLPLNESPQATDKYYGYYHVTSMSGAVEKAEVKMILRDFEENGIDRRVNAIKAIANAVEAMFQGGKVDVKTTVSYYNMKQGVMKEPRVLDIVKRAGEIHGIKLISEPIRGGTDGSHLTHVGIPTPNIYTGDFNMHSRRECVALSQMVSATEIVIETINLWSKEH